MSVLDTLDDRMLMACESLLAIVFAVVFLGMRRLFPGLRGVRSIALSFLLVLPDTLFIALHGNLSTVVTVLMANTFLLASLIAMYEGTVEFTGDRSQRWMLWLSAFFTFAVGYFYTEVKHDIVPCLIAMSLTMALIRGVTAFALLRRSMRTANQRAMRLFGVVTALLAGLALYRAWVTIAVGAQQSAAQQDAGQAGLLIGGVFSLGVSGLFFLLLTGREMAASRRLQIQRETETGLSSRESLEAALALELQHVLYDGDMLSVALAAVDDLERILETQGRGVANAAVREVSETMATQLRKSDQLGRFGTDRFLLIFAETGHDQAARGAERIAGQVAKLHSRGGTRPLTLSIGLTQAWRGDDVASLLARAELALAQARSDGRNCLRVRLPEADTSPDEGIRAVA